MTALTSTPPQTPTPALDITPIRGTLPVPGFGVLPVNAYLLDGAEPMLIDCGPPASRHAFLEQLRSCIDVRTLRWIWVTHADADHTGALESLLALAPEARVVTNYLGLGKLAMQGLLTPERAYLINPGQTLSLTDRELVAVSLPSYDAPETMGAFDSATHSLFSSDCFGALLPNEETATAADASQIPSEQLARGLATWASVDAPWLAHLTHAAFWNAARPLAELSPARVLSAHLPPASNQLGTLLECLDAARGAPLFVGPDQRAMQASA